AWDQIRSLSSPSNLRNALTHPSVDAVRSENPHYPRTARSGGTRTFLFLRLYLRGASLTSFAKLLFKGRGDFGRKLMTQFNRRAVECRQQCALQFRRCSKHFLVELWIGRVGERRPVLVNLRRQQQTPVPPEGVLLVQSDLSGCDRALVVVRRITGVVDRVRVVERLGGLNGAVEVRIGIEGKGSAVGIVAGLGGNPVSGERIPVTVGRCVRGLGGDGRRCNTGVVRGARGNHWQIKSTGIALLHHDH